MTNLPIRSIYITVIIQKESGGANGSIPLTFLANTLGCRKRLSWKRPGSGREAIWRVKYCTILYSTVQHSTAQYCTAQYCTVLHSTVQYCTVLYSTVLYTAVQILVPACLDFGPRINHMISKSRPPEASKMISLDRFLATFAIAPLKETTWGLTGHFFVRGWCALRPHPIFCCCFIFSPPCLDSNADMHKSRLY